MDAQTPTLTPSLTARTFGLVFAVLCYVATNIGLVTMIVFVNDLYPPVASVSGPAVFGFLAAFAINLGLTLLWGVQHSLMARGAFKRALARVLPNSVERALYCLASAAALVVVCLGWARIPGQLWSVESEALRVVLSVAGASGWLLLLAATFEIGHFELFGLKQAWFAFRNRPMPRAPFQARLIYGMVRHPIQTGLLMGMWLAPTMSASRALFAAFMTFYMLVGL
ncbi:MAG: NnrU family protein, partial [Myxococcota bacterium]